MLLSSWNDIVQIKGVAAAQASMGFHSDGEIVSVLVLVSLVMLVIQVNLPSKTVPVIASSIVNACVVSCSATRPLCDTVSFG